MDKIEQIKNLTTILNEASSKYYNGIESEMTDKEWDLKLCELQKLENETGFSLSNSPTQKVGYEVLSELEKVTHSHKMLSLDKTKSEEDLVKFAGNEDSLLMCKMDGLTVLLTYENGDLVQAETRGNGEVGEIITHNAKVFENIPLHIDYTGHLEIEGEAIITYEDFEKINSELPDNEKYKNPRNLVSGSVRLLDSGIAAQRHIKFIAWKIPTEKDYMLAGFQDAKELGFEIVPYVLIKGSEHHYNKYIEHLKDIASKKGYPIDGLVIAYNDIAYGESLGMTEHHPKHSLAFKFYDEEVSTTLKDIEWSMGKTGKLTPVAIFDEIELEGTTVSKASLHNISICKNLKLGIGDEVTVYKANQIIPQLRDNITKSNTFTIPDKCPICNRETKVIKENDTEVLICTNFNCKGKLLGKLKHFVSREAINIDGISEATLQFLIDKGWVTNFSDLFYLGEYKEEWSKYEGFGKKSISKILDNIEKSKNTELWRFIYSLSIPLIGKTASKAIEKEIINNTIVFYEEDPFLNFKLGFKVKYDWKCIPDFGDKMAISLSQYYNEHSQEIDELASYFNFINPIQKNKSNVNDKINNKIFAITGSLTHFSNRNELINKIEELGGKVSGSVSSKTNYLINNDKESSSSKNKKAKSYGIPIISEEDFLKMNE